MVSKPDMPQQGRLDAPLDRVARQHQARVETISPRVEALHARRRGLVPKAVLPRALDPTHRKIDPRTAFIAMAEACAGRAIHMGVATHDRRVAEPALDLLVRAGTPWALEQLVSLLRLDSVADRRATEEPPWAGAGIRFSDANLTRRPARGHRAALQPSTAIWVRGSSAHSVIRCTYRGVANGSMNPSGTCDFEVSMANETVEQARLEPKVAQAAPETRSQGLRPGRFNRLRGRGLVAIATVIVVVGVAAYIGGVLPSGFSKAAVGGSQPAGAQAQSTQSGTGKREVSDKFYKPTDAQWQTLGVETAKEIAFRTWLTTDGKIAINEDNTTPVFSPYAGRVIKLLAKPGDHIEKGKPLFVVEASDMVQGQNDFLAARANVNKAKSQLDVATVVLKRHRDLVLINAVAKRELEQAEIGHVAAVNDLKSAEVALEAARNRLRILGKTDAEVADFEQGRFGINAETTVNSPLSGTIVQRKVGPGQFVTNSSNDPVFVIGDLSTVWLIGNVRETDATKVAVGQPVEFTVLAQPEMTYRTTLTYLAASINPDTHRLQVRAEVANPQGQLRPEMFANVAISIGAETMSASVPRHALIYEGDNARLWVVRGDKSIELRRVVTGVANNVSVQILSGLQVGEQFVAKGALFIDRLASPVVEQD